HNLHRGRATTRTDPKPPAPTPGATPPTPPVVTPRRSASSGTTANFSQFLVDSAPNWKLGTSSTISWPATSRGGNGNGGGAQIVKTTPGAVGDVGFSHPQASRLSYASPHNKESKHIPPSVQSATTAADNATINPDLTFSAIWAPGAQSYPITYQTWDLVYQKQSSTNTAKMLKAYIGYLLGPGQQLLTGLNYAPLPASLD